jgi:hypothetical protein
MTSAKNSAAIFSGIFKRQIIPLLQAEGLTRLIVPRAELQKTFLPRGVEATRHKMQGQRVASRRARLSGPSAYYKEDGLLEHRVISLTYVTAGQIDFPCGKYILHCGAGFWILKPPGVPGSDGSKSFTKDGESCDILSISPRGRGVHLWIRHSRGARYELLPGENIFIPSGEAVQFLDIISEEIMATRPHWAEVCLSALLALCFVVKRELEIGRFLLISGGLREEEKTGNGYDPVVQAQNYIKAHLNEHLTMERVARSVHLSWAPARRDRCRHRFIHWKKIYAITNRNNYWDWFRK